MRGRVLGPESTTPGDIRASAGTGVARGAGEAAAAVVLAVEAVGLREPDGVEEAVALLEVARLEGGAAGARRSAAASRPAAKTRGLDLCGLTVSVVENASNPSSAAFAAARPRLWRKQRSQRAPPSGSASSPATARSHEAGS